MKTKNLLLIAIAIFALYSCNNKESEVEQPEQKILTLEKITIVDTMTLTVDSTVTIQAIITPKELTEKTQLLWTSTNTTVATVTNGTVKAIKKGTCNIIVSSTDKLFKDTCILTVKDKPRVVIPPTITFSNLKTGSTSMTIDDNYNVQNFIFGEKISGTVEFKATYYLNSFSMSFNTNLVSSWGFSSNNWWTDYITYSYEKPQNGAYMYTLSMGCSRVSINFSFYPRGTDTQTIPITFCASDRYGDSTEIILNFKK